MSDRRIQLVEELNEGARLRPKRDWADLPVTRRVLETLIWKLKDADVLTYDAACALLDTLEAGDA